MYYVYIFASGRNGTLYIGITNDLLRRIEEHKSKLIPGFTTKYDITKLVHFEATESRYAAIQREKQLKAWRRAWKLELIESNNPNWDDLYPSIAGTGFQLSLE